jgi:AcrR family transcriptional regulator
MAKLSTADRISQAALTILEAEGPEAVSMRRVADAVGITPMAIYHHFPNREALLNTITNQEFATLLSYIEMRPRRGSLDALLISVMEAYIDYAFDRPRIFDYVFAQPRPGARRYPDDFRARRSPTLNPIADAVRAAMRAGLLRNDDVWEVALELWGLTHGYVALYRAGRFNLPEKEFRALVRRALRRLIHGLTVPNRKAASLKA